MDEASAHAVSDVVRGDATTPEHGDVARDAARAPGERRMELESHRMVAGQEERDAGAGVVVECGEVERAAQGAATVDSPHGHWWAENPLEPVVRAVECPAAAGAGARDQ